MIRKKNVMLIGLVVLLVTCCTAYAGDAKIKWGAVSGEVVGYKLCYGTSSGSYPNQIDVGNVTEYSLANLSLEAGTTYYFVVRAYNQYCESSDSDMVSYTTDGATGEIPLESEPDIPPLDTTPPLNPQGVTAQLLDGNLYVRWQAVVAEDLAGYRVYYGVASRNYAPSIPVDNVTQYRVDNLESGTTYYFAVTAVDTASNESGFSPEAFITIPAAVVVDNPPSITITAPVATGTYTSATGGVTMTGTAMDDKGISQIKWSNSLGGNGTATGTTDWSTGSISLSEGTNVLSVTALDTTGQSTSKSIEVVYQVAVTDTEKPVVVISSPVTAGRTFYTTRGAVNVAGTASDNKELSKVTWTNATTGQGGTALETTSWFAGNIPLKSGDNVITISAYDAAQNKGSASITVNYMAPDTENPIVTFTSPVAAGRTFYTTRGAVNVAGTASDNKELSKVTWINATTGQSGTALETTSWFVGNIQLKSGNNVITISAYDAAQNKGSESITVNYMAPDTENPMVTLTSPTTGTAYATATGTLNMAGASSDNKGVTRVTWANAATGATGAASGTTSWSATNIALKPGVNTVTVTAFDEAGNQGSHACQVTYNEPDTVKPTLYVVSPMTASTYSTDQPFILISGKAQDNKDVSRVTWANGATSARGTAEGTYNWSTGSIALVPGSNAITMAAYDSAGNMGAITVYVTYKDAQAPAIALKSPVTGTSYRTDSSQVTLTGIAADNVGVTRVTWANAAGGSGTASGTTSWTVGNIALKEGLNEIVVTAYDAAGNNSSHSLGVFYTPPDTERPVIQLLSPPTTTYNTTSSTISLSGTATDNIGVTQVTWTNSDGSSGIASGTSSWAVNNMNLQVGSNTIVIGAVDAAGNKGTLSLVVDYSPPVSSGVDGPTGSTDGTIQTDAVVTDSPTDGQTDLSDSDTSKIKSDKLKKDSFKSKFLRYFNIGL